MIDEKTENALMIELHKSIYESSNGALEELDNPSLTYPPGVKLSPSEKKALHNLNLTSDEKSALMKIITDSCAYPLFNLFCLLDGVGDPDSEEITEWYGLTLSEKDEEDSVMLHDNFYDSFHMFYETM